MSAYVYERLSLLSSGGMGKIWRARHPEHPQPIALKTLLSPDAVMRESLRQEILLLQQLSHPQIISCLDADPLGEEPWLAMPLIEGETFRSCVLKQRVADDADTQERFAPSLPRSTASLAGGHQTILVNDPSLELDEPTRCSVRHLIHLCHVLAYLHGEGVVHADLKPENLLIDQERRLTLIDFGIAAPVGGRLDIERLRKAGLVRGTPYYMAPEQIMGHPIDARVDLYSLGVMLYEVLTGRLPFYGESLSALLASKVQASLIPPQQLNTQLPGPISDMIVRLLDPRPSRRPGHALIVAQSLSMLVQATEVSQIPLRDYLYQSAHIGHQEPLKQLLYGRSPVQALIGEAGVGKSRLLSELITALRAQGESVQVSFAALPAHQRPLGPMLDLLAELLARDGALDASAEQEVLGLLTYQGDVGEWLEQLRAHFTCAAVDSHWYTLIIDDAQWLDAKTLEFLKLFIHNPIPQTRIILSGRPHDVWSNLSISTHVLGPLTVTESSALISQMLGLEQAPQALLDHLEPLAQGNPMRISDMLHQLIDHGALRRDALGRWQFDASQAQAQHFNTRDRLVALRVPAHHPYVHKVLDALSVWGGSISLKLLSSFLGVECEELTLWCTELHARGLVCFKEPKGVDFAHHELMAHWCDQVSAELKQHWHRKFAQWWQDQCQQEDSSLWARVAHHWIGAQQQEKAAYAYNRAALALVTIDPREAETYFLRAQALDPNKIEHKLNYWRHILQVQARYEEWERQLKGVDLAQLSAEECCEVDLARAFLLTKRSRLHQAQALLLALLQRRPSAELRCRVLYTLSRVCAEIGAFKEAQVYLGQLMSAMHLLPPEHPLRCLGPAAFGIVLSLQDEPEQALPWFDMVLTHMPAHPSAVRAEVMTGKAQALARRGELLKALALLQEVELHQRQLGDRASLSVTTHELARIYIELGELDMAEPILRDSLVMLHAQTQSRMLGFAYLHLSTLHMLRGQLHESLQTASYALEQLSGHGELRAKAWLQLQMAQVAFELGALREARAYLMQVISLEREARVESLIIRAYLWLSLVDLLSSTTPLVASAPAARCLEPQCALSATELGAIALELCSIAALVPSLKLPVHKWQPLLPARVFRLQDRLLWALTQSLWSSEQSITTALEATAEATPFKAWWASWRLASIQSDEAMVALQRQGALALASAPLAKLLRQRLL